eukprot:TRINITY_DN1633_c0_g3_i3.p1 TRINITY_DN1633_c0_g3~~TRINITY_DN1633_c0_g3_i3.p1  ORF type:complete len:190 (-),score=18.66 TRINITY_DN1633_c0_g3_i3:132-701(-)
MGANKGFVVAVTFYISVSFLSYWFYVVLPWRWWESIIGLVHIFFFNLVVFLLLHCYYLAISTSPGIVPPGWAPNLTSTQRELFFQGKYITRKIHGTNSPFEPRWCSICEAFKPPRSHHCRELGACILKMDHYCPWIDNCVGYRNHKFFILFVFYASLGLSNLIFISFFRLIVDVVWLKVGRIVGTWSGG